VPYTRRLTLPDIYFLDSTNITSFKSVDEHVFVRYLNPTDIDLRSIFETLATRNHQKFAFGIATDVSLANAENIPVPSIVCYKPSEGEQELSYGEWGLESLDSFIEASTTPLIGELTRRNEMKYLQAGKSLLYIFAVTPSERSHYQSLPKTLARSTESTSTS
jgi:protein disulfide-isomerase A1